jgi:hypothetical protein
MLDIIADEIGQRLLPTPTEGLLAATSDVLQLCLSVHTGCSDGSCPFEVMEAMRTVGTAFSPTHESSQILEETYCHTFNDLDLAGSQAVTLSDLLPKVNQLRTTVEVELSRLPCQRKLEDVCWRLLTMQQPLVELPGQYTNDREPTPEQHILLERFSSDLQVVHDTATGTTSREFVAVGDDGNMHHFAVRIGSMLKQQASHSLELMMQLARLLNRRLLKSREARQRMLILHMPSAVRLGQASLIQAGTPAISLATLNAQSRTKPDPLLHAVATHHQQVVTRLNESTESEVTYQKLRRALEEACTQVEATHFSHAVHAALPDSAAWWNAQRSLVSQLGLQASLCHVIGMRATSAWSLAIQRDSGSVEMLGFDPQPLRCLQVGAPTMPFRLTRNVQHLLNPFGVDGRFSGALCAAVACIAVAHECPLGHWLDFLSSIQSVDIGLQNQATVPWDATGVEAEARACDLAPNIIVGRARTTQTADVSTNVHMLIDLATSIDHLHMMAPTWMAFL